MNKPLLQKKYRFIKNRRPLKLQTKLFFAYMFTSEIILLIFAVFFYQYVTPILTHNEISAVRTINTSFKDSIDSVLEGLDITSTNINYSSLMSDKLDASFNLKLNQTKLREVADLFVTINGTDIKSDQINLYDFEGNVVRVGMVTNAITVNPDTLLWFNDAIKLNGIKLIGTPFYTASYSATSTYADWFISLYRTYSNPYGRKVGAVETLKRCKSVFKSVISYQKKNAHSLRSYIFNREGILVYPYDISAVEKKELSYYYSSITTLDSQHYINNTLTNESELLIYETSPYSGWTYIAIKPKSQILEPVYRLRTLLLMIVALILFLSVSVSYYLSQRMVKPVKQLKEIIQQLELNTLGASPAQAIGTYYDELDEVYQAFHYMSDKLKISMNDLIDTRQQELKSRTMALQSQTNPHFYYNTLSSIIVLSENSQQQEVITLCRNLTQIMRYITDNSSTIVTLQEEMDYVQKYLHCMKVRYQSSLNITLDLDPKLLDLPVPKLIIQPLVENAIKYGTDCIPPWSITIRGTYTDAFWKIDIIDSGNGFSSEALAKIRKRIDYIDANPGMPEMKIDGLGLLNVHMRWKLFAKDAYYFEIKNNEAGHGIVSIGMKP
jgi:two-component system, sensor histidine kinase YesM